LLVPLYGLAVADVTLADGGPLAPLVSLVLGNLTMAMAVGVDATGKLTQRTFAGVTQARLVGGFGGWSKRITIGPYGMPSGVRASTVARDLAAATGERVSIATDKTIGPFYVPGRNVSAAAILRAIAGALWWCDEKGQTKIAGKRTPAPIRSAANVTRFDGDTRILRVATEDVAAWLPGATFTGATVPQTVTVQASRMHVANDGTLRIEAMVA
jgi:hypothetical protein